MKKWLKISILAALAIGMVIISGCTSTGSTSAAQSTPPPSPTPPPRPTLSTTGPVAIDSHIITNKSGSDVPIAQITQPPVNLTSKNEQIQTFAESIRKIQKTGIHSIPIIDVEYHYNAGMNSGDLIDNMNRNGVALTWLSPNEESINDSIRLNKLYPDKFVPTTVAGDGPLWHGSETNFLKKLDGEVRSGNYFAMGEFEGRHYPSDTNNRDIHMPLNSTAFEIVFKASSDTGVPFLIHHEAEDAMLPELESMLAKYPKAKVVWCHFGRNRNYVTWSKFMTPDAPRALLNKYPNLYFDLLQLQPGEKYQNGYVQTIMYDDTTSTLKPEWKQVILDYPDLFVLGSDINGGRFGKYDQVMNTFRQTILPELPKDVAEKIAYKNAWKLMTGEDWKE